MNDQLDMFDFLTKTNYAPDYKNNVDSIILSDITGGKEYKNNDWIYPKATKETIERLKIITKYGYNFNDSNNNLIALYLTENSYRNHDINMQVFIEGIEPFIDWLLNNYPENYKLAKNYLSPKLLKKYKHLDSLDKYNL